MSSTLNRSDRRAGTRIPCEIPVTLTSLDPVDPFSEPCQVVLANLGGCAVRCSRSIGVGAAVQLQGLPVTSNVTGRVVHTISFGAEAGFWLLGLALDEPGNVWGIQTPPADWVAPAETA